MKFFFSKCFHSILKLFSAIHTLTGYMKYLALKMQFDTHSLAVVLLRFLTKTMLNLYISPWLIKKKKRKEKRFLAPTQAPLTSELSSPHLAVNSPCIDIFSMWKHGSTLFPENLKMICSSTEAKGPPSLALFIVTAPWSNCEESGPRGNYDHFTYSNAVRRHFFSKD